MINKKVIIQLQNERIYLNEGKFLTLKKKTLYDLYKNKDLSFEDMLFNLKYVEEYDSYLITYSNYGKTSIYDMLCDKEKLIFQDYFLKPKNKFLCFKNKNLCFKNKNLCFKNNNEVLERIYSFKEYEERKMIDHKDPNYDPHQLDDHSQILPELVSHRKTSSNKEKEESYRDLSYDRKHSTSRLTFSYQKFPEKRFKKEAKHY
jgi:hypothetical protein